jgi:hypothetical protein
MKKLIFNLSRFLLMPVLNLIHRKRLPNFTKDFEGERVYMISELPAAKIGGWVSVEEKPNLAIHTLGIGTLINRLTQNQKH